MAWDERGLRLDLNISFDVRGGLLMRQIHHWAADLFMGRSSST